MAGKAGRFAAGAILIGAGLYLSFELGRYRSGFSLLDERRRAAGYETALDERDQAIGELERTVAILRTSEDIDRRAYASVEANLAELEARIQAQEEELGFYRGIVSPGDGVTGVRIQSVEVEPREGPASYALRVLLIQAIVHTDLVTGSVRGSLRGTRDGEAAEYPLDELGNESRARDMAYEFRYFQTLETRLVLPEGFEPAELEIQVWPRSPQGERIVQGFSWAAVSGQQ